MIIQSIAEVPETNRTFHSLQARRAQVLMLLLMPLLFLDSVTGFLLRAQGSSFLSLSQIYKLALLTYALYLVFVVANWKNVIELCFFSLFLLLSSLLNAFENGLSYPTANLILFSRFLMLCALFFGCRSLLVLGMQTNVILNIFVVNWLIIIGNVCLSRLGLGFRSYSIGANQGYVGFFYAANEVSVTLVVLSFLIMMSVRMHKWRFFVVAGISVLVSVLINTRTAIFGVVLSVAIIAYYSLKLRNKQKVRLLCYLSAAVIVYFVLMRPSYFLGLILKVFVFRGVSANVEQSAATLLLSSRNIYVTQRLTPIISNLTWSDWLFGFRNGATVEIDVLDLFMNFGLVGVSIVIGFYVGLFFRQRKLTRRSHNNIAAQVAALDLLIIVISFIAGHTLLSGLAVPFIALANAMPYIWQKSEPP